MLMNLDLIDKIKTYKKRTLKILNKNGILIHYCTTQRNGKIDWIRPRVRTGWPKSKIGKMGWRQNRILRSTHFSDFRFRSPTHRGHSKFSVRWIRRKLRPYFYNKPVLGQKFWDKFTPSTHRWGQNLWTIIVTKLEVLLIKNVKYCQNRYL